MASDRKNLYEFRRELWWQAWNGTRTVASSASAVATERQARCVHPWDQLIWVSNQDGHFAQRKHGKQCDLKNMLYFSQRHAVLTASSPSEVLNAQSSLPIGQVILDSSCRTAVAGKHRRESF